MKALMSQPAPRPDLSITMRFDPEEGITDLETHLDQLKREADQATARLVLSSTGAMAIEVRPA